MSESCRASQGPTSRSRERTYSTAYEPVRSNGPWGPRTSETCDLRPCSGHDPRSSIGGRAVSTIRGGTDEDLPELREERSAAARPLRALPCPAARVPPVVGTRPVARTPARPSVGRPKRVHRTQAPFASNMNGATPVAIERMMAIT